MDNLFQTSIEDFLIGNLRARIGMSCVIKIRTLLEIYQRHVFIKENCVYQVSNIRESD